jgi:hypothetical protein
MLSTATGNGHALKFKEALGAFDRVHLVTKNTPYSSMLFNNAVRNGTNRRAESVKAIGNLIIFDIDEGMTLHDAISNAKDYKSLIVTSKSHGIEKHGITGDRYRVIIPIYSLTLLTLQIPKENYSAFYSFVAQFLGFDTFDKATKDIARFYYPNPSQEVFYSDSNEVLEFEILFNAFLDHKKLSEAYNKRPYAPQTSSGSRNHLLKNELPLNQIFESRNNELISWSDAGVKPLPVKCIFPEKHKNGDKNASAFIILDSGKQKPRFSCSGCGASFWMGAV